MAERVLFVHAHPDDETLYTGATIATLIDRGAEVSVLTCTRGELGGADASRREQELEQALTALGVTDHRYLGEPGARWEGRSPRRYRDSGPGGTLPDPASLAAADPGEIAADVAAALIALSPDVVVSYDSDGASGHPDHVRTHEATRTAAQVLRVPFYVLGDKHATVRVDPAPVIERKRAAVAAHGSQLRLDGDTIIVSPTHSMPLSAVESYRRLRPAGSAFADYGLGARILTCVLALVLGVFVGATLTVAHQATLSIGDLRVPWGIIASIIITAALVVGLRLVFETRIVAGVAALGLLGASAFLALQSSGGSILVPDNVAGYVWTFAPVLIAGIALAWPQVTPRRPSNIGASSSKGSVS